MVIKEPAEVEDEDLSEERLDQLVLPRTVGLLDAEAAELLGVVVDLQVARGGPVVLDRHGHAAPLETVEAVPVEPHQMAQVPRVKDVLVDEIAIPVERVVGGVEPRQK